ncbi:MAG TPA: transposase, partial [Acidimicrobiales bacterium]|nr:transposase [Acidimicrobiales bacterium]
TRHLLDHGIAVVEVDRPNRQTRRRRGKTDPLDAVSAARAAQSGDADGQAKSRDGNVESIGALLVAVGDNRSRMRSEATLAHRCGSAPIEASTGKVTRHRLDRGGDRPANSALWRIVITRMACDPRTRPTSSNAPRRAVRSLRSSVVSSATSSARVRLPVELKEGLTTPRSIIRRCP